MPCIVYLQIISISPLFIWAILFTKDQIQTWPTIYIYVGSLAAKESALGFHGPLHKAWNLLNPNPPEKKTRHGFV